MPVPNIRIQYYDNVASAFKNLDHRLVDDYSHSFELSRFGQFNFRYPIGAKAWDKLKDRVILKMFEGDDLIYAGKVVQNSEILIGGERLVSIQGFNILIEFLEEFTVANIGLNNELYSDLLDPSYPKTIIRPTTWDSTLLDSAGDLTYLTSLQSSLSLFEIVTKHSGLQYRWAGDVSNFRKVEWGYFGDDSGVRLYKKPKSVRELGDDLLMIQDLEIEEDYREIENYVYIIGGGGSNGLNQLTLRDVDPLIIDPFYPILVDPNTPNDAVNYDGTVFAENKTGPNNFAAYYLTDTASVTQFGAIKAAYEFNDIFPQPTGTDGAYSDSDRQNAANELYKVAVEQLKKQKDTKRFYRVTCYGETNNFDIGDSISLKFQGEVTKIVNGEPVVTAYADINDDFYVVRKRVSYRPEGKQFELELAEKMMLSEGDGDVVADTIRSVKVSSRQRSGNVVPMETNRKDSFDSTHPAKFTYWVPKGLVYANYVDMKLSVRPFRAYSKAVEGGGAYASTTAGGGGIFTTSDPEGTGTTGHIHTAQVLGSASSAATLESLGYKYLMVQPAASGVDPGPCLVDTGDLGLLWAPDAEDEVSSVSFHTNCTLTAHDHTFTLPNHTHGFTIPDHTHDIEFGIYEDATPPNNVTVWIDGINYSASTEIGGGKSAFGNYPSDAQDTYSLIKAAIELGVLNTLLTPGLHEIEVKCSADLGLVELTIYSQFYLSSQ